jgi:acetoin utilization protein AcuB
MTAKELISAEIRPLKTSNTGDFAIDAMSDYHVRHLPIVNNEQLLGLISEEEILDFDTDEAVGSYSLSLVHPFVQDTDHIYTVMQRLHENRLTLIPVINNDNKYLGVVTLYDLLKYFAQSASFSEPGAVVVLEINKRDYTLSQIARIVESEGAVILNAFITSEPDSMALEVTLKINRVDIARIINTFVRYNYLIKATFAEADYLDSMHEHYESLMRYLNV